MEVAVQPSRPRWLRAHWKLVVAVCLGLSLAGTVAALVLMANSDAAKLSISTAESNAVLSEKLGVPMKTGWFISGKVAGEHAELAIPISGPRSRGTIYSQSRKLAGVWQLDSLEFVGKESGEHLNLLTPNVPEKMAGSLGESTDPQAAVMIARVKDVSASMLERGLPTVRLEDWVTANAGPDWTLSWGFSQGPKNAANHMLDFPDSVDIRGDTKDGRYFRLSIGTTTNANRVFLFWLSGAANVQHRWVGLKHLSQLPRLLHHGSQVRILRRARSDEDNYVGALYEADPRGERLRTSCRLG